MSEGKEEQSYAKCQATKKHVYKIVDENHNKINFSIDSPRMIPTHITPVPEKVEIKSLPVISCQAVSSQTKSQNKNDVSDDNKNPNNAYLTKDELNEWTFNYCMLQKDSKMIQWKLRPYLERKRLLCLDINKKALGLREHYLCMTNRLWMMGLINRPSFSAKGTKLKLGDFMGTSHMD